MNANETQFSLRPEPKQELTAVLFSVGIFVSLVLFVAQISCGKNGSHKGHSAAELRSAATKYAAAKRRLGGSAPRPPAFLRHSSDVPMAGRDDDLGVQWRCREKRKWAMLASNPPRDIPTSDAPIARLALAGCPARAVFLWRAVARRELERAEDLGKHTEKARRCW